MTDVALCALVFALFAGLSYLSACVYRAAHGARPPSRLIRFLETLRVYLADEADE